MNFQTLLFACMITLCGRATAADEQAIGLENLQWEYRVIIILVHEPNSQSALTKLDEFAPEIRDRDIAWFVLGENLVQTNYRGKLDAEIRDQLMERYFTPVPTNSSVLLIGKDGTLKSKSSDLDLEAIFGLIDQMPMRREELRRRNNKSSSP